METGRVRESVLSKNTLQVSGFKSRRLELKSSVLARLIAGIEIVGVQNAL